MQTKHIFTLTVLSASLLPVSAALAQNDTADAGASAVASSTMEVGEFRDRLTELRGVLSDMRENSQLALASQSVVEQGNYQRMNRHLLHRALGITDEVTMNWKRIDTPETNVQNFGSRDMARFAAESHDTAFVRNTVTQIQSQLLAAKLNGRDTGVVTGEMTSMLDAAIERAGNPNFRVAGASSGSYRSSLSQIQWRDLGEASASTPSPAGGETVASAREWKEVTIEHENLPARNQVAMADTTTTETYTETETVPETPERVGAAELPRTGGDPGMLLLFGSTLMGAGGLLLRKRR